MCVEASCVAAERVSIRTYPSIVTPIVYEWQDQLDTISLGCRYHVIESLKTIRAEVEVRSRRVEDLKVDFVRIGGGWVWDGINISESPDSKDLVSGLDCV